jgi:hypothetical protein
MVEVKKEEKEEVEEEEGGGNERINGNALGLMTGE